MSKHKRQRPKLGMLALEPRWMFDGAVGVTHAHEAASAAELALIPTVPAGCNARRRPTGACPC